MFGEERKARELKLKKEKEDQKIMRDKYTALVRSVKSDCRRDGSGLLAVTYQLELIETTNCKTPTDLSRSMVIEAYKEAIEKYKLKQDKDAKKRIEKGL